MDACLDTLSDDLCQVNTHVGCIAKRQACLGGFVESPSPLPKASKDNDKSLGGVFTLRNVVRTLCIFFFSSILDTLFMYLRSCDHFVIANLVLVDIYTFEVVITVLSPISSCVVSFLTLYTCFLYNVYNLLFLFYTKMP